MTRVAKATERPYHSQLRTEQAEETRARILDATGRVMARGVAALSIPAVAQEAGVSVPTIYRHFGTKQELIGAMYPHLLARVGASQPPPPRSLKEFRDGLRAYVDFLDSIDDVTRTAMASPVVEEARRISMPRRIAIWQQVADDSAPTASAVDRVRVARLMNVLTASAAHRLWRDHFGASAAETASDIDWLVRAAVAAATKGGER